MEQTFKPAKIISMMQDEIGKTNLYDQCEFNKHYRKLFQTVIKNMKNAGVEYNFKMKAFYDIETNPNYQTFSALEIVQMAMDEKEKFEKEINKVSHGMREALEELKQILNKKTSY